MGGHKRRDPEIHTIVKGPTVSWDLPADRLDQLIDRAFRLFPRVIAVRTDTAVTYAELQDRVEVLAAHLRRASFEQGSAVVVRIGRSLDYLVALCAAAKIGSPFIPVAPTEPEERLRSIVENCRAGVVIEATPTRTGSSFVFTAVEVSQSVEALPDDTAYVMHTSGSTGIPKGVVVPTAVLLHCLTWHRHFLDVSATDRIAHITQPTFDVSLPELFLPMLCGAEMLLPPASLQTDVVGVLSHLARNRVTIIQFVPTVLSRVTRLLRAMPELRREFQSLRHIVCAGEELTDPLRQAVYECFPQATVHNCYGPTETCVIVTDHVCGRESYPGSVPIGLPAPNTLFHIAASDDAPTEPGFVCGELLVAGAQLASGYANNPSETAARFQVHATADGPVRFYRTGDWVSVAPEGNLRYIGRRDDQVKIRGVRIELSEIATVAAESGGCDAARVIVLDQGWDGGEAGPSLLCAVSPKDADRTKIRSAFDRLLPPDRIPRSIVCMDDFPYTPNGKLDRGMLQRLARGEQDQPPRAGPSGQVDAVPGTPVLVGILEDLLKRPITAATVVAELSLDSLQLVELQIALAELSWRFEGDVLQAHDMTVGVWSGLLVRAGSLPALSSSGNPLDDRTRLDTTAFFHTLFVQRPEIVVFHSSLSGVSGIAASTLADTIVDLVRQSLADTTWLFPAFTTEYVHEKRYDDASSRSQTGVLARVVQERLDGKRTRHPVYSFVAAGSRAKEFGEKDYWLHHPFGDDSIFAEISQARSFLVGFGTDEFAHSHRCEYVAGVPYLMMALVSGEMRYSGTVVEGTTTVYSRDVPRSDDACLLRQDVPGMMAMIDAHVCRHDVGRSSAFYVSVSDLERELVTAVREDPLCLLKRDNAERLPSWLRTRAVRRLRDQPSAETADGRRAIALHHEGLR